MSTVSCRIFNVAFMHLPDIGLSVKEWCEGLPITPEYLKNPENNLDWKLFLELLERLETILGGPTNLENYVKDDLNYLDTGSIMRLFGFALTPRQLYRLAALSMHVTSPVVKPSMLALKDGRIIFKMTLLPGFQANEQLYTCCKGYMIGLPRVIGLGTSLVQMEKSQNDIRFLITPPPSKTILSRMSNAWQLVRGSDAVIERLSLQQRELMHQTRQLTKANMEKEALLQEATKLRNTLSDILDAMPSVLIGVDENLTVTMWNDMATEYTGIPTQQAVGQQLHSLTDKLTPFTPQIKNAVHLRKTVSVPKQKRIQQEETIFEDITVYPISTNHLKGVIIRIDDVTQRVFTEEMMIQSEKMLSVGGLAAGMAHELRNPLAGIIQSTQVIINRTHSKLAKNRSAAEHCGTNMNTINRYLDLRGIPGMLQSIVDSANRGVHIVENALNFSRKSESVFSACHIPQLLDTTLELAANSYNPQYTFDFKYIQIIKEYEDDLPIIYCDKIKIQQVVLNLLTNGAHAMFDKHQASSSEVPRFIIRANQEEDMLRIEIEDNGPGMDEKTSQKIFQPFYTQKKAGEGTGLGLSLSHFIISENHKGTLTVKTVLNVGSTFIIRLPL